MFKENFNSKQQGNVGISAAILYFTQLGNTVSIPLNDAQEYDLVVDINNVLNKVQVKTTRKKTPEGVYSVELRSSGGTKGITYHRVSDSLCDLLFVLTYDGDKYLIPRNRFIKNRSSINLGKDMEEYRI